jgi:hypothetical protein
MSYTAPSVTASGATFAQFQAGGASGHLELLIAAQAATAAPTVKASWTATGGGSSGGTLAAGTYYGVVTESNGFGETTASPEQDQITVSAGNIPRITFQTLKTGNVSRNVYLGAKNGSSGGPYYLYARGVTASTYDISAAIATNDYAATTPPTVNTTGFTYTDANGNVHKKRLELLRSAKDGNLEDVYRYLRTLVADFNRGNPMGYTNTVNRLRDAHATFAILATLCSEIGTLIDANPGTTGRSTNGIGLATTRRTWP